MRVVLIAAVIAASLGGCARRIRPVPPAVPGPAPVPVMPFADDPVSFLVPSRRLSPGEVTIVRVCVGPDRSISSADIMESSGDPRFDTLALDWARRIQLRATPPAGGAPMLPCGEVRVEVRTPVEPRGLSRPDTSLG